MAISRLTSVEADRRGRSPRSKKQPPNMRLKLAALLLKETVCCLMFRTSAAA